MSLNGVNSNYQAYEANTASGSDKKVSTKEISKTTAYSDVAATYEHTSQSEGLVTAVNKKASNASIVAQLKADLDTRMSQMQSLVTKMFSKQGITIGTADDMWKALAGGNFTADADTIAQAKEDISENGYWGVKHGQFAFCNSYRLITGFGKRLNALNHIAATTSRLCLRKSSPMKT